MMYSSRLTFVLPHKLNSVKVCQIKSLHFALSYFTRLICVRIETQEILLL